MAAKRHERTRARRAALQVLYTSEITEKSPTALTENADGCLVDDGSLPEYALVLVRGTEAHRCAIDEQLAATSENWSLARMPIVDRSILRLATYEMMFVDDVPVSVAINEAVELAKDYGGEDESPRFVNGVLGRIAKRIGDDPDALSASTPTEEGEASQEQLPQDERAEQPTPDAPADHAEQPTPDAPAEALRAGCAESEGSHGI